MKRLMIEVFVTAALVVCLIFLSVTRDNALERAAHFEGAAEEHKEHEQRLANELAAAIEQKNDLENEIFAQKMQKAEIKREIIEVEVVKEVEVPVSSWDFEYTQEDVDILAAVMYGEEYPNRYEMMLAGSVVLNRVLDERFPGTIKDVVYEICGPYEQYAPRTKGFIGAELPEECYQLARILLDHGSIAPRDVVYQAHFNQGEVFWEWKGEEFCYG